jgi:hypothetical protein
VAEPRIKDVRLMMAPACTALKARQNLRFSPDAIESSYFCWTEQARNIFF